MGEALSHPKQEWGGTELLYRQEWGGTELLYRQECGATELPWTGLGRHWVTLRTGMGRHWVTLQTGMWRHWVTLNRIGEALSYSIDRNGGHQVLCRQMGRHWVNNYIVFTNIGWSLFSPLCVHWPCLQCFNVWTRWCNNSQSYKN